MKYLAALLTSAKHNPGKRLGLAKCALLLLSVSAPGHAQVAQAPEAQVKAAYLLKFGAYVDWPGHAFAQANSPFVIGVHGSTPILMHLEQAATGRSVNGHPVEIRRIQRQDPLQGVHILFVAGHEQQRITDLTAWTKGVPLLTVSDDSEPRGSTINFVVVDDRVRFDISLASSEEAGIRISSRLLGVARKITGKPS
ncbi:MAG: hypothetical protein RJB60_763 [Pseudomonadota bacterium]